MANRTDQRTVQCFQMACNASLSGALAQDRDGRCVECVDADRPRQPLGETTCRGPWGRSKDRNRGGTTARGVMGAGPGNPVYAGVFRAMKVVMAAGSRSTGVNAAVVRNGP